MKKSTKYSNHSTISATSAIDTADTADCTKVKILALHGKGGSGTEFQRNLDPITSAIESRFGEDVQIEYLTAPFEGGQWWTLPPGVRSFNAKQYEGFETSADLIQNAITSKSDGGFNIILGHSQGAILLSALIALGNEVILDSLKGAILNGAAWPNPYSKNLESFDLKKCEAQKVNSSLFSTLFIIGENDTINPPEGARRVRECLEKGGIITSTVEHPGGHSVPVKDEKAIGDILDWIECLVQRSFTSNL